MLLVRVPHGLDPIVPNDPGLFEVPVSELRICRIVSEGPLATRAPLSAATEIGYGYRGVPHTRFHFFLDSASLEGSNSGKSHRGSRRLRSCCTDLAPARALSASARANLS